MAARATKRDSNKPAKTTGSAIRFEATKVDNLPLVLDAIAWLDAPSNAQISQFAGLDPRTTGKLLKNCT